MHRLSPNIWQFLHWMRMPQGGVAVRSGVSDTGMMSGFSPEMRMLNSTPVTEGWVRMWPLTTDSTVEMLSPTKSRQRLYRPETVNPLAK